MNSKFILIEQVLTLDIKIWTSVYGLVSWQNTIDHEKNVINHFIFLGWGKLLLLIVQNAISIISVKKENKQ